MMEQYRLKKWYPSLDKQLFEGDVLAFTKEIYVCENGYTITVGEAKSNPEFWEPVKEKDYEILKLRPNSKHPNYHIGSTPSHIYPYDDRLSTKYFDIYSVKRLSDGEVFTVGDGVKSTTHNDEGKIYEFKIEGSTIRASVSKLYYNIKYIQHIKQPLFITEDGKEIFEGDKFWLVTTAYDIRTSHGGNRFQYQYRKKFSIREKAEQWIDNNKPQYCKNDVKDLLHKISDTCSINIDNCLKYIEK